MHPDAEPWWRQAVADLETAQVTLAAGRFDATALFAHLAVELGLKALFIDQHGALARRVHDLELLGRDVGVPPTVGAPLVLLNPMFGLARYPDDRTGRAPTELLTRAAAQLALSVSEEVIAWLREQLQA